MEERGVTLLNLPVEIQTKIFSHLAVSFGKSTIQAILRTCKQLYEVALPLSVSVFRNTVRCPKGKGPCSRTRNILFLRYILISKPWLARHVKTIIFGRVSTNYGADRDAEEKYEDSEYWEQHQGAITSEELEVYQQHIEYILGQIPCSYTDIWRVGWVEDLKNGTSDAQVALILLTCPNIRRILFERPACRSNVHQLICFIRHLVDINASIQTPGSEWGDGNHPQMIIPLSNVQDVFHETMDYSEGYFEYYLDAPYLFALPRLRFYECILALGSFNAAEIFKSLRRRTSLVEEITLHCSCYNAEALYNMFGACKAVKKFEFTYQKLETFSGLMTPRDVLDAVLPHADTLEDLYLNFEDNYDKLWAIFNPPEKLYMGIGLRQMHVLKRLTLTMQALTGMLAFQPVNYDDVANHVPLKVEGAARIVDCLPENLEYLSIRDCGKLILDQVEELMTVVGHRFKSLTYIGLIFNGWRMDLEVDGPEVEKLKNYTATNVCLDIIFRSEIGYIWDLGRYLALGDTNDETNLMSRIYAPHVRRYYLETRGSIPDEELGIGVDPSWCEE